MASGNYHGEETNAGARIGTAGEPVYRNGKVVARNISPMQPSISAVRMTSARMSL